MKAHKRIRAYRESNGISAADMARRLEIAESTLRSIENGNRPVTPEMAVKIEEVIGISRSEFHPKLFSGMVA